MGTYKKDETPERDSEAWKELEIEDTDRKIEQLLENLSAQNAVIEKLKENWKLSVKN